MQRVFVLRDDGHARNLWAFLKSNWQGMANAGKPLAVTVTEYKSKRSIEQNKRYWAILNEIADTAYVDGKQYSADSWHEFYKRKLIGCVDLPDGQLVGMSSTSLSVEEFGNYMMKVEVHATSELGCEIIC
jgi:hypothetical protein